MSNFFDILLDLLLPLLSLLPHLLELGPVELVAVPIKIIFGHFFMEALQVAHKVSAPVEVLD